MFCRHITVAALRWMATSEAFHPCFCIKYGSYKSPFRGWF